MLVFSSLITNHNNCEAWIYGCLNHRPHPWIYEKKDFYLFGTEYYGDEDAIPKYAIPHFALDHAHIIDNALNAEYHYYLKNIKYLAGVPFSRDPDYELNILIMEFDEETYQETKSFLFESYTKKPEEEDPFLHYRADGPQHSLNGYDFYEYLVRYWSQKWSFIYHAFNDEQNTIVMFVFQIHPAVEFVDRFYDENGSFRDFPVMLEEYFGQFYDFNETDDGAEEEKQEQASGFGEET